MEKEKFILSYFPLINYPQLKLNLFHFYIRLNSLNDFQNYYEKKLTNVNEIVSITWLLGKYDLEIQIINKNKKDALRILTNIIPSKEISEIKMLKSEKLQIYSMDIDNKQDNKLITEINNSPKQLDSYDLKLINLLAKNGRAKIIDIADNLNLEQDNIRYRIKKLQENKTIYGFYTRTNKHRCGLNTYLLLLKSKKELTKENILQLERLSNLFYLKKCTQPGNYIIRFHSSNNKDLIAILTKIREVLGLNLISLDVHTILERKKFIPFEII
jgi:DNA-binding Lrp family transcriptional regulator